MKRQGIHLSLLLLLITQSVAYAGTNTANTDEKTAESATETIINIDAKTLGLENELNNELQHKINNELNSELDNELFTPVIAESPLSDFPAPVLEEMQKRELDPDWFSFVVTPLGSNDKLKVADAQQQDIQQNNTQQNKTQAQSQTQQNNEQTLALQGLYSQTSQAIAPLNSVYAHLANTPRVPASTMKLIPTFIATDTLGKDFVWQTSVYHSGVRIGDRLYGNLIIKGSGDPKLTHHKIEQLLYQVQQAGIRHIEGNIIIDSRIFHNVGKDPAVFDNEPLKPYNASPDGMLVNFSTVNINSYPLSNQSAELLYTPKLADIHLPSRIALTSGHCRGSIFRQLNPSWQTTQLNLHAIPQGCVGQGLYLAYPNPKTFAQQVVKSKWLELGNTLNGEVRDINSKPVLTPKRTQLGYVGLYKRMEHNTLPIASVLSPPLSEQIYDINHYSNNVMTEQLTLSIPAYQANNNEQKTIQPKTKQQGIDYPQALNSIQAWWRKNLTTPPPQMTNGSGLCRTCTLTVNNLDELLQSAYRHPQFSSYLHSLGVAGVSGTIKTHKYRRPNSSAIGRAWIKTGTLDNVTAMAGYVKGKSGQDYSVVAIINLPTGKTHANSKRPVLDALLDWVAGH